MPNTMPDPQRGPIPPLGGCSSSDAVVRHLGPTAVKTSLMFGLLSWGRGRGRESLERGSGREQPLADRATHIGAGPSGCYTRTFRRRTCLGWCFRPAYDSVAADT